MIGWRARLGFLIPPGCPSVEGEAFAMAPAGVSVHFGRMVAAGQAGVIQGQQTERRRSMVDRIDEPIELLKLVKPDVMVLTLTAASYYLGREKEAELIRRQEDKLGIPFTTAFASAVRGLQHLGVTRIALGAPYAEPVVLQCKEALESHGLQVVRHANVPDVRNIYVDTDEHSAYRVARLADCDEAEAIYLAGVGMPTVGMLKTIEQDRGKPVVSSVSASVWNALRLAGVPAMSPGFGRLLEAR